MAEASSKQLGGRLANRSMLGQVVVLAMWPFFELVLHTLVGMVDTAIAGRLGDEDNPDPVNAIAIAGYIGWLLNMLNGALGVGSSALLARAVGGRYKRLINASVGQGILLAMIWGTIYGAVVFALARPISSFFGLTGDALDMAALYVMVVAVTGPISALLFTGNALLRAAGDTRSPFYAMALVNVINIGLSLLLVFGPEPIGGHGILGTALGTALAWVIGSVVIMSLLLSGKGVIQLRWQRVKPHWHTSRRIIKVAVPALVESSGMWIGNAIVGRIVGGLGIAAGLGSHMVAIRVESLSFLPAFALGTAASVLVGQYLGMGDPQRARQAVRLCWGIGAGIMTMMGILFMTIPEALTRLLTDKPEVYELAARLVFICGPVQLFFGSYLVLSQALRGAGDTRTTMMLTYLSTFLIRLPAAYLIGDYFGYGLEGLWIGICGELVIRGILYIGRYRMDAWTKVKV